MSALTLADRILVALASEPMSEQDFAVSFPKTSRDALRAKLSELRKLGQIVERDGVFRIPPGKSVAPEAVAKVEAAQRAEVDAAKQNQTIAVTSAAAQRRGTPVKARETPEPARMKACARCRETKPLTAFARSAKAADGLYAYCRECSSAYRAERKRELAEKLAKADGQRRGVSVEISASAPSRKPGEGIAELLAKEIKNRDVVIIDPKPATPSAPEEAPTGEASKVVQFPGPKSLEDVVARHTAPSGVTVRTLTSIVFRDPETGAAYGLLLSPAGVKLLREALAS